MTGHAVPGASAVPDRAAAGHDGGEPAVGERQVPFFCPYCGEETLRPAGPEAGEWQCDSCTRSFRLRLAGAPR